MYHQFKELGGPRHHEGADGGRPDDALRHGRRARRSPTRRCRASRACSPAGECAAGINGANRLGGNSLSDLLVFGKRAGEYAAKYAKDNPRRARSTTTRWRPRAKWRWSRSIARRGESPFKMQQDLQDMMQDLVGIVRKEDEMQRRSTGWKSCSERAAKVQRDGQPRVQPRLAHRAGPAQPADRLRGGHAGRASLRKESRGGQFRDDYPEKDDGSSAR